MALSHTLSAIAASKHKKKKGEPVPQAPKGGKSLPPWLKGKK